MLLVGNGRVITRDETQPFLEDGCVAIRDNIIVSVGPTKELQESFPEADFLDAGGRLIMPGFINTHMHLYSTFARGMAIRTVPPQTFQEILERLWWRLDKALTPEAVYYSAMPVLIDCIRRGVTTVFDHHASPAAVRDSLFILAEAARKAGIRSCLCYEVSDRDGQEVARQGIEENREFITCCRQAEDEMITGLFGLHAAFTLNDTTLEQCCRAGSDLDSGFHIHVAEGPEDLQHSVQQYGKRVVERLADFGILSAKTLAAHCVYIDAREMDLLMASRTTVIHNPQSNMGNAVGCAPVLELMRRGIMVGLGTDGYTADMLESLKTASLLHKHHWRNPSVAWNEPPTMLFRNNATVASAQFNGVLGILTPGAYADVIVVDYHPPTPLNADNLDAHLLFGVSGLAVDITVINGRARMLERQLVDIDEAEVAAKAREWAADIWKTI